MQAHSRSWSMRSVKEKHVWESSSGQTQVAVAAFLPFIRKRKSIFTSNINLLEPSRVCVKASGLESEEEKRERERDEIS